MPPSVFDPAAILGCTPEEARSLLRGRQVTPGEVEAVAQFHYRWREHLHDDASYWVVASQAAQILQVSLSQVHDLLRRRRLPYITDRAGVRLMRRREIEAIATHLADRRPIR